MDNSNILVVDDDSEIRTLLAEYLKKNGFHADCVPDGKALWKWLESHSADLIVLDLMLPGEDGLSICQTLRKTSQTPVLMLTARGEEVDKILGLEMGADDYLVKPFSPRELLARIRTILRRVKPDGQTIRVIHRYLCFHGWTLDTTARELSSPDGVVVPLSGGEYRLLKVFLDNPQRVISRDFIMDSLAGREAEAFDRSIDVQMSRLRQKLGDDARDPKLLKTVRGEGYVLAAEVVGRQA